MCGCGFHNPATVFMTLAAWSKAAMMKQTRHSTEPSQQTLLPGCRCNFNKTNGMISCRSFVATSLIRTYVLYSGRWFKLWSPPILPISSLIMGIQKKIGTKTYSRKKAAVDKSTANGKVSEGNAEPKPQCCSVLWALRSFYDAKFWG